MKKFWDKLVAGWNYFFTALKLDQEDKVKSLETGIPVPNPGANLKNWWKLFGIFFVLVSLCLFVLMRILNPKFTGYVDKRKNHHGINRRGERY